MSHGLGWEGVGVLLHVGHVGLGKEGVEGLRKIECVFGENIYIYIYNRDVVLHSVYHGKDGFCTKAMTFG